MKMTLEVFDALQVGDVIPGGPLLPGLSPENLRMRVKERTAERVDFVVTYFGVTLGNWKAHRAEETVKWAT